MFYKFFVKGIVQGVGFRPYIYKKAIKLKLKGFVKNVGSGVEIVVDNKDFISNLTDLPTLARIDSHTVEEIDFNANNFTIKKSSESQGSTIIPPDLFMCEDCLRELNDENNRRHQYYFITCTNCGPRFSMITNYPYD